MNRKLLSVILALVMVLGAFVPVFAEEATTTEAPKAPATEKHIEFLKEQGIIKGDKTGDLMLEKNIDRASFAAILVRAAGKEATAESVKSLPGRFKDMTAAHWANGYATVAHDNNLMKGNPAGEFMPGKQISYAEIATTLVRFLGKEKTGFVYPTSYIAAATELGLFADVEIGGMYNSNATRDNVFKMLYNALSKEDFGRYNVYKAIVLENNRVAQLKADEVKAEVLSVVQIANNVSERGTAKVGQQMVFNLKGVKVEDSKKKTIADSESLFGKVANFTLDQNNNLVKVEVDNTYDYIWGEINSLNEKELTVNYVKYGVRVDERYYYGDRTYRSTERDDRVYRTYLTTSGNSKHPAEFAQNYNYQEVAKRYNLKDTDPDKLNASLVRATIKDGRVLFVDLYNLTDIAPVQKVARDGKDVYYYNDMRNGAVDRLVLRGIDRILSYNEETGFANYSMDKIKANDTIHWMDGFYIVRTDAPLTGKLVKTYLNAAGESGVIAREGKDNVDVYLNTKTYSREPYQAVFAYKENIYRRLDSRAQLEEMVGDNVTILRDIFDGNQLINSGRTLIQGLALIDRVRSAKGVQLYAPNGAERFRLNDDWDSNYYNGGIWNLSGADRFDTFRPFDLAYVGGDSEGKVKIVANIKPHEEYEKLYGDAEFEKDYHRYLRVGKRLRTKEGKIVDGKWETAVDYRFGDDTDVFVVEYKKGFKEEYRPYFVRANMADVIAKNKDNKELRAYVLSEAEFKKFLETDTELMKNTWGMFERPKYAKAIIFTDANSVKLEEKYDIVKLVSVDMYSQTAVVEKSEGVRETLKINENSPIELKDDLRRTSKDPDNVFDLYEDETGRKYRVGKFYKIKRVEGELKEGEVREATFDEKLELIPFELDGNYRYDGYFNARVNNSVDGPVITFYVDSRVTKEWGSNRLRTGFLYADKENYVDVIQFTGHVGEIKYQYVKKAEADIADKAAKADAAAAKAFEEKLSLVGETPTEAQVNLVKAEYAKLNAAQRELVKPTIAKHKSDDIKNIPLLVEADEQKTKVEALETTPASGTLKANTNKADAQKVLDSAKETLTKLAFAGLTSAAEYTSLETVVNRVQGLVDKLK